MNTLTKTSSLMDLFRSDLDSLFTSPMFTTLPNKYPATNIIENEKEIKIEIPVPGFKKNELEVTVENKILSIRGNKQSSKESNGDKYLTREFAQESFVKNYKVDLSLSEESISSKLEDGILLVTLPKAKKIDNKKLIDIVSS